MLSSRHIRLFRSVCRVTILLEGPLAADSFRVLDAQDLGEDGRLVQAVPLSLGSGHLWLAMLAHATSSDSGPVLSHALEGLRFLRIVTPGLEAALEKEKARTPVRKAALRDSTRQPAAAPPLTTRKRIARGAIAPKSPPKIPMSAWHIERSDQPTRCSNLPADRSPGSHSQKRRGTRSWLSRPKHLSLQSLSKVWMASSTCSVRPARSVDPV